MRYPEAKAKAAAELEFIKLEITEVGNRFRANVVDGTESEIPTDLHELYRRERTLEEIIEKFEPIYEVGDGISNVLYSDVNPYTIISISPNGKTMKVRSCTAELSPDYKPDAVIGGFSAHTVNNYDQKWIITEDLNGSVRTISLRKNGKWVAVGSSMNGGTRWVPNRSKFYDYNF